MVNINSYLEKRNSVTVMTFMFTEEEYPDAVWVFETKAGLKGDKVYSHTMCQPCHKIWKKGLYCPECNGVFGRSKHTIVAKYEKTELKKRIYC